MVKNISILKLSILAIASIMTISLLGVSNSVNAQEQGSDVEIEIINKLGTDLYYQETVERQAVQIKSDPPSEIIAGDTGSFKVGPGDSTKKIHLEIAYYVGEKGASETVSFGFNAAAEQFYDDRSCFTDTPADISGSHEGCDKSTIKFTFQPK